MSLYLCPAPYTDKEIEAHERTREKKKVTERKKHLKHQMKQILMISLQAIKNIKQSFRFT